MRRSRWFRASRKRIGSGAARYEKTGDSSELTRIGDQLGLRFRDQSGDVERLIEQARTADQPRFSLLERGDRIARRLDAGQCQSTVTDASLRYRKACVQSLLAWQAERVRRERWHGEREGT